jgi:pimeloyl-ACP methyl ester carboxylesterase
MAQTPEGRAAPGRATDASGQIEAAVAYPAWRRVSLKEQWDRFVSEVPAGFTAPMSRRHFDEWAPSYLDSDPESRIHSPESVGVPNGPIEDIAAAWAGNLAYDPHLIRVPVAIIRGEWDSVSTDADARWLYDSLQSSPMRRDVKISRATHQMHLEEGRRQLYRETQCFLDGEGTSDGTTG